MASRLTGQLPVAVATSDSLLSLSSVRVDFNGTCALNLDQFDVPGAAGVAAILLGPNGAGKTTLLNAVTGYVHASRPARIILRSPSARDLVVLNRPAIVRAGVARTFQTTPRFGSLTVRESLNLAALVADSGSPLSCGLRWLSPFSHRERTASLLHGLVESCGLQPLVDARLASLPMDLLRRVELARALMMQPRLLMLDEPSASLDGEAREWLAGFLRHDLARLIIELHAARLYRHSAVTTCVVTHDLGLARRLANGTGLDSPVVHVLHQGRVVASGRLDEVLGSAEVRKAYLGDD